MQLLRVLHFPEYLLGEGLIATIEPPSLDERALLLKDALALGNVSFGLSQVPLQSQAFFGIHCFHA